MSTRRVHRYILLIILLILCVLKYSIANAQSQDIIINELMWAGSEVSSADEWIELRNLSSNDIDLSGWKIKYGNDDEMVSIASGIIPANGYFLIANSSESHQYAQGESILNITPDYIDSGVSLSNDSLQIKLVDNLDNIIDIAGNGSKPLAGNNDKKYSMERNDQITDGLIASSWHTATSSINLDVISQAKATPKAKNSSSLFQSIGSYSQDLDKYITVINCLEAKGIVTNIVDGDTIDIDLNGEITRVRLVGIDAPESSKSSDFKIDEPYYQESKNYIANLILNQQVTIIVSNDPNSQYDKYQRLLGLIVINDQNVNSLSIREGFSKTYYLDNPIIRKNGWLDEEKYAQVNNNGVWKYFGFTSNIFINEIMPNPSGEDSQGEWIELYNASNQEIDLSNWFIDDSQYGSNPYLIPNGVKISPRGYYVISIVDSKIALNNSGDQVRLFTPDLNIAHEIQYIDTAKEEISYMKSETGEFMWTKTSTPGAKNIYTDPDRPDYQKVEEIIELKDQSAGDYVEVDGYVNTKPHQIADQYFYIEDNSAGVQIYNYNKDFPDLQIGQKIKVYGEISDASILRVKIKNLQDIILLNEIINFEPPKFSPSEVKDSYIGKLIKVQGEISKLSGQTFYVKDEHLEFTIQIRGPTNFKRPELERGDVVEITGILYQSSQKNISLLPRFLDDIKVIKRIQPNSSLKDPISVDKIENLKLYNEDEYLLVRGIVNSIPGMLGERFFYIQDDTAGVEIYSHYKYFPSLKIGDYIEVIGKLSASKKRIKVYSENDFRIISENNELEPININDNTDLPNCFGKLVFIKGTVIAKKNQKFTISLNDKKYIIYLKDSTNIKPSILKVGDNVLIFGIVDEYRGEYRINPRFIEDITYQRKTRQQKTQVKGATTIKSFSKKISLPKMEKYLAKAPQNQYNLETLKNVVKTAIAVLQLLLIGLIIEWLWIKQYT